MDGTQFDNLTRLLGRGADRRRVLRMILGGVGALATTGVTRQVAGAQGCNNDSDCTEPCTACSGGQCVAYAEYCQATEQCYNPQTGGCCTDDECGGCGTCTNNMCTPVSGCCNNDSDCTEPCTSCQDGSCLAYAEYCPETGQCYDRKVGGCCTADECGGCATCTNNMCTPIANCCDEHTDCGRCNQCVDGTCTPIPNCCSTDDDCDQCSSCEAGTCVPYAEYCPETHQCYKTMIGECCYDSECGNDYCVHGKCHQCPAGWKYCKHTKSCYDPSEMCCSDRECTDHWGGQCIHGDCEYPSCIGKGGSCGSSDECCGNLICPEGICVHRHRPHTPPPPATPTNPSVPTTLPATGAGSSSDDSSSAAGITLAAGAAALLAAKYLRGNATEESSEES